MIIVYMFSLEQTCLMSCKLIMMITTYYAFSEVCHSLYQCLSTPVRWAKNAKSWARVVKYTKVVTKYI